MSWLFGSASWKSAVSTVTAKGCAVYENFEMVNIFYETLSKANFYTSI